MVKCVFYVEKEKFLRSLFEVALKARKQEIYTVESLQKNLYLLEDLRPQLVILDTETVKSTPELVRDVFNYRIKYPGVKIVLTGREEDIEVLGERADAFLLKPILATNLASRILSLID